LSEVVDGKLEDAESLREERPEKKWEAAFIHPSAQQKTFPIVLLILLCGESQPLAKVSA